MQPLGDPSGGGGNRDDIWKLHAPLKVERVLWLALQKKLLTWDVGIKQGWIEPSKCTLCRSTEETATHLFVQCQFVQLV
jgi:hypothetical protein